MTGFCGSALKRKRQSRPAFSVRHVNPIAGALGLRPPAAVEGPCGSRIPAISLLACTRQPATLPAAMIGHILPHYRLAFLLALLAPLASSVLGADTKPQRVPWTTSRI